MVEEVKGIYHEEQSYRFCVLIGKELATCSIQQMLENTPIQLFNFLTKFLRYMRHILKEEIEKAEEEVRAKRYKFKSIDTVSKTLNLTERINSKVNGIHFGRNREEV